MNDIKVAFWNLGNLFDTTSSEIASDLEFTPDRGWDQDQKNKKIDNLAQIISSLHTNQGPDLIGLCEIENQELAKQLISNMNRQDDYQIAEYRDSPDVRGIDTCLIYSNRVFKFVSAKSHNIYLRYPTRDIFQIRLQVIENGAELDVLVNHWPSRTSGHYESEPLRIAVAENCAKIVESILKIPQNELLHMPNNLKNDNESIAKLNQQWNKNIIVMGDLNDQPFDKSIMNYLRATPNENQMMEWKELYEHPNMKKWPASEQTDKHNYLYQPAYLYNCIWKLIPDGTLFYDGKLDLFDQFIISRGLYYGKQGLKMNLERVKIDKKSKLADHVLPDRFDPNNSNKIHPIYKVSPMKFVYSRKKPNGNPEDLPAGRDALTGYSDHFPVETVIEIMDRP